MDARVAHDNMFCVRSVLKIWKPFDMLADFKYLFRATIVPGFISELARSHLPGSPFPRARLS